MDLVVGIGYSSNIQTAYDVISEIMEEDNRIHSDPSPQIAVLELADSSVNLVAGLWVKKEVLPDFAYSPI